MQNDNFKDFSVELNTTETILSFHSTPISILKDEIFLADGKITNCDSKHYIEISSVSNTEEITVVLEESGKTYYTTLYESSFSGNKVFINYLKNCSYKETHVAKFRCFIPTEKSNKEVFHFQFETISYSDLKTIYDCIRISVNGYMFDILQVKHNERVYFVIDSFNEMTFDQFADYCFSIQQALGFITGYMPGGKLFYFYNENEFYYSNIGRHAMKMLHCPIHTNPHSFIQFKGTTALNFCHKLNVLPSNVFATLVALIHSNDSFSSMIMTIIEGESLHSLLITPCIYSVALENLSQLINPKENKKPINNKELFNKLKDDIIKVIDNYSDQLDERGLKKLKGRINNLNHPINIGNNNEKLKSPFDILGIELKNYDEMILEHRNDLLHGNILLSSEERIKDEQINDYLGYTSAKLYTLVSSLILKYVGYSGYIINHAKAYERYNNIETDEDYYIYI